MPSASGSELHLLHEFGRVLETRYRNEHTDVIAEVPESIRKRLAGFLLEG